MAATSGICAVTGRNKAKDLLDHLTPTSSTTATAITVTGPLKIAMQTALVNNDTAATTHECSDANYARQSVTAYNADSVTSGQGYGVGIVAKTNSVVLTFGGSTGMAAAQTFTGFIAASSDATPVECIYGNFAAGVSVPINNQYVVASGSLSLGIS